MTTTKSQLSLVRASKETHQQHEKMLLTVSRIQTESLTLQPNRIVLAQRRQNKLSISKMVNSLKADEKLLKM